MMDGYWCSVQSWDLKVQFGEVLLCHLRQGLQCRWHHRLEINELVWCVQDDIMHYCRSLQQLRNYSGLPGGKCWAFMLMVFWQPSSYICLPIVFISPYVIFHLQKTYNWLQYVRSSNKNNDRIWIRLCTYIHRLIITSFGWPLWVLLRKLTLL